MNDMDWVRSGWRKVKSTFRVLKNFSQIKLDREIKFKPKKVQPICLPSKIQEQASHLLTQTPTTRMRTESPTWQDGAGSFTDG